jgi:hypothetical protein
MSISVLARNLRDAGNAGQWKIRTGTDACGCPDRAATKANTIGSGTAFTWARYSDPANPTDVSG